MNLFNAEMLPGVVHNTNDEKHLGRVQAVVPGLFDNSVMDDEALPWIRPLMTFGYQTFSKMPVGAKIWVLQNKDNYNEFWYIPMFETNNTVKEFLNENESLDTEVLFWRNNGAKMTYDNNNGYLIENNSGQVAVKANGEVDIKSSNSSGISVTPSQITIGANQEKLEPSVHGDALVDVLEQFKSILVKMLDVCKPSYQLQVLGNNPALRQEIQNIKFDNIRSKNVKIS